MQKQTSKYNNSIDTLVNNKNTSILKDSISLDSTNNIIYGTSISNIESEDTTTVWNNLHLLNLSTDKKPTTENGHEGIKIPFKLEHIDGIFGLLIVCFFLFSRIYSGGVSILKENISRFFTLSNNKKIHEEHLSKRTLLNYFIIIQSIILSSIGIYDIFIEFNTINDNISPLLHILCFMLILGIFYILKINGYKLLGYIFGMKPLTKISIQSQITIIQIVGILYFIPILLLVYSNIWHLEIIILMIALFVILQLIFFYKISIFFIQEKFNFLFLIAYLCSIEIIPYIFLTIGLIYSYNNIDILYLLWH